MPPAFLGSCTGGEDKEYEPNYRDPEVIVWDFLQTLHEVDDFLLAGFWTEYYLSAPQANVAAAMNGILEEWRFETGKNGMITVSDTNNEQYLVDTHGKTLQDADEGWHIEKIKRASWAARTPKECIISDDVVGNYNE
ncbi:MAG: hypothetical protein LIO77_06405 [Rikenellaceae bacterium]|nr:hypothetical protein [Rikenellaceae bacterium]